MIKKAAILCGGLGTRLRPLTLSVPKPMAAVNGRPFLDHLLEQLREAGIEECLLMTGYRQDQIIEHYGHGEGFGLKIRYSQGAVDWLTAKRLFVARSQLDEPFLLLYADNFAPLNLPRLERAAEDALITCTLAAKQPGNIDLGPDGQVKQFAKTRSQDLGFVEVGYMLVKPEALQLLDGANVSFNRVLEQVAAMNRMRGIVSATGYVSISDPERLKDAARYLTPKKILLIDRDGIINVKAPRGEYIGSWQDFEFISSHVEAMQALAAMGYRFVVLSNQVGIGRGMVSESAVREIHDQMRLALEERGVHLAGIYICPHHWEDGCRCRKPEPGLFQQVAYDLGIRMDKTIYIGDDARDCQAAAAAGCSSMFIGPEEALVALESWQRPRYVFASLLDALPVLGAAQPDLRSLEIMAAVDPGAAYSGGGVQLS